MQFLARQNHIKIGFENHPQNLILVVHRKATRKIGFTTFQADNEGGFQRRDSLRKLRMLPMVKPTVSSDVRNPYFFMSFTLQLQQPVDLSVSDSKIVNPFDVSISKYVHSIRLISLVKIIAYVLYLCRYEKYILRTLTKYGEF